MRRTLDGRLVNYDEPDENEIALAYVIKCAEEVGVKVIPNETAISIRFIADVMKKMKGKET